MTTSGETDPGRAMTRLLRVGERGVRRVVRLVMPHEPANLATDRGRAVDRNRRAALTSVAGIGTRLFSLALSLITIPILLHYLGIERYGIWLTIYAGAAWLGLVQLGLAPSLLNRLSALGREDEAQGQRLVATAFWLEVVIAVIALVPLVILYQVAAWNDVFNVPPGPLADDARTVTAAVWIGLALGLPWSIAAAVLRAKQEGYIANAWDFGAALVRFALLVLLVALDAGIGALAVALVIGGLAVHVVMAATVFLRRWPELRPTIRRFEGSIVPSLVRTGIAFTVLSIAALVILSTDLIVITQVLGPASVPAYAIAFSFVTLFISLELAVLDAVWPAYSEAAARGDRSWLVRTHRRVVRLCTLAGVIFAILLITFGQSFIGIWAGPEVVPPQSLLVVLGALVVVQAFELSYGRILAALGHVQSYALLGLANAAINLPLSILLAHEMGITGVALGTLIGYLLTGGPLVIRTRIAIGRIPVNAPRPAPTTTPETQPIRPAASP